MTEEKTFEEALSALEQTVARLEQGQLPLDEALDCFEVGVASANLCRKKLKAVESRIEALMKDANGSLFTEPLAPQGEQD